MKSVCPVRSDHEGRPMPHLMTSRERWREKHGPWRPWKPVCSYCGLGLHSDSVMVELVNCR